MLSTGKQLGRYRIHSEIGSGGMGEVLLAEDTELERLVALKVLPLAVASNTERVRRFVQEAKAASALNHPNILTIYEIGQIDGSRFIASEFIKGETLRERLKPDKSVSYSQILDITIQIASALQAAHQANIIHRDIKPENIMLREDGLVKVLDFGLAKLTEEKFPLNKSEALTLAQVNTQAGTILGTVGYMSPEQARGKPVDERTDIWGLGVVLYEMLTRRKPFEGETTSDVLAAILTGEPKSLRSCNPEIPAEFERIIHKTLAKDKEKRYQTAGHLLEELKEFKQNLDFKSNLDRTNLANKQTKTKTRILEVDTDKTINISTNSIKGIPTNESPFIESTNKSKFLHKSRYSLLLVFGLIGISLFVYFLIQTTSVNPPKPEAVKFFNNGTEALRDGTYFKASKMLEDAIRIDPDFFNAHAALAEAWMELDYFGRAQSEMLKVNELQRKRQTFLSPFFQTKILIT